MQRVMIGGRRLRYNYLLVTGDRYHRWRRISTSNRSAHRRAISTFESHRHHSHSTTYCNTATPTIIPSFSTNLTTNNNNGPTTKHRLFWSSTDEIAEAVENDDTHTTSLLPISPITPSNISAISLLSSTTLDSLNSLPECKFVLDLLNGTADDVSTGRSESGSSISITKVKEANQNLSRANDILSSMPDLQMSISLLEIDLLIICGKFTEALSKLNQYEVYLTKQQNQVEAEGVGEKGGYDTKQYHHGHSERDTTKRQYDTFEEAKESIQRMRLKGKDPSNSLIPYYNPQLGKYLIGNDINSGTSNTMSSNTLLQLQIIKSKLLVSLGQYEYALSEYEHMLENMEREVERQMNRVLALQQQQQQQDGSSDQQKEMQKEMEMPTDTLPVIHGASALTGVGVTKLLLHLREQDTTSSSSTDTTTNNSTSEIEDIIESIQTATEILLESRTDAIKSTLHTTLAVDLGIAASISLTNLGITHVLLSPNNNTNTTKTKKRAMKYWKKGIQTLDLILENAVTSTIIIPRYKFQLMESVRARLYCNIAYVLLGLDDNINIKDGNAKLDQATDEKTLKEASDAAKKALDIYDELLNGSKMTRGEDSCERDTQDADTGKKDDTKEDTTTSEEWEKILKDQASLPDEEYDPNKKSKDIPISTLWKSYHKAESARALGLVAQCYAMAGAAVTAEGLFQSALDASSSYPIGQSLSSKDTNTGRGVSLSSTNLGLIARDVRLWYANLCNNWDKRKGDADRLREEAMVIEDEGVLKDYIRLDGTGEKRSVSGLESSLWIFSPGDFER